MARIFSIQFMYEGTTQNAMISVRATPFFTEYAVLLQDEQLADLLPNYKILSTSKDSFIFADSTAENSPVLMQPILQAVIGHVQTINA